MSGVTVKLTYVFTFVWKENICQAAAVKELCDYFQDTQSNISAVISGDFVRLQIHPYANKHHTSN